MQQPGPILILGGTTEARELAARLQADGRDFVYSLAGRTEDPLTVGAVRTGGFGGVDGLAAYLRDNRITAVVDATHPFAATMSRNAARSCRATGVQLIRLERPGWESHPAAAAWDWVDDHVEAAGAVRGRRVFLTVGRLHTLDYSPALDDRFVLARVTEPPDRDLPAAWVLLTSRGPFTLDGERSLFRDNAFDCLVTKDSGGAQTAAKLTAATEAGAQVVVVRRSAADPGVRRASTVDGVLAALADQEAGDLSR